MLHEPISFSGNESLTIQNMIRALPNSFTYEFWVKPAGAGIHLGAEASYGIYGNTGQAYIIGPACGEHSDEAGIGISIGVNGISVYEHTIDHLPAVLVYPVSINQWAHVALVYQDKVPSLYVNGRLAKKGQPSIKSMIYPSLVLGGLSPYGCFQGEMKELRVWNHARTHGQISSSMHSSLSGNEIGLYWYSNHKTNLLVHQGLKRTMEVSLVLPSYNRYPYNLLTLFSLQKQTFDLSKVEVIMVDNASDDSTPSIVQKNEFPFVFKYIKCEKNVGRPRSRNMGIRAANGKVIIFLDAEVLVGPDFIEQHVQAHQARDRYIAIGTIHLRGVYSLIHPGFSSGQFEHIKAIMSKCKQEYSKRWRKYATSPQITPLLNKEDLENVQLLNSLSFLKPHEEYYEKEVLQHYGDQLSGFMFPWIFFYTGNISLRRSFLGQAGFFEEWDGYGWDDVEMGYRLFKMGAQFVNLGKMVTYHQEHPISASIGEEANLNFYKFQMKHSVIDVQIFALNLVPHAKTLYQLNQILTQYKALCYENAREFGLFKQTFVTLLERASYRLAHKMEVTKLLLPDEPSYSKIQEEKYRISQMGKYPMVIDAFETLCRL
ncbi:glycosyltransferase [Bacillus sp. 3255]|uniref:glycosyltransferase n=1 Tax=Bacillus sp. 3255 TaxID=2817904 RepID=UPI00285CEAAF|nr:glycosyltransferase [Bacillus sp. 3255]MDR6883156.1 GT2 family glycosyltransferase [Bacillus sp. 3255]